MQSGGNEKIEARQAWFCQDPCRYATTSQDFVFVDLFFFLAVGLDIFTGKKHDEILRDEAQVVVNEKYELSLVDVDENRVSLMTDTGEIREDLNLPPGETGDEIKDKFAEGMQIKVTILKALGKELIVGWSEDKS